MFTNCKQTEKSYQSPIKNLLLRINPYAGTRPFIRNFLLQVSSTCCAMILRRETPFCFDIKVVASFNLDRYFHLHLISIFLQKVFPFGLAVELLMQGIIIAIVFFVVWFDGFGVGSKGRVDIGGWVGRMCKVLLCSQACPFEVRRLLSFSDLTQFKSHLVSKYVQL